MKLLEKREEFLCNLEQILYNMFCSLGYSKESLKQSLLHKTKVRQLLNTTEYSILNHNRSDCNCGVYCIYNFISKKRYIGSSVDLEGRKYSHFNDLKKGEHTDKIQKSYNKYGKDAFVFFIICFCETRDRVELRNLEQSYINSQLFAKEYIETSFRDKRFLENGYNLRPLVDTPTGFRHSEKSRRHMSEIKKGKSFHSQEQLENIRLSGLDKEKQLSRKIGRDNYWEKVRRGEIIRKKK